MGSPSAPQGGMQQSMGQPQSPQQGKGPQQGPQQGGMPPMRQQGPQQGKGPGLPMPGGQQFDGQRHPYQPAGANNGPFGQNPVRPVNQPTQMPQGKGPGLGGQQPNQAILDQIKQAYQMQQGQPMPPGAVPGAPPPGQVRPPGMPFYGNPNPATYGSVNNNGVTAQTPMPADQAQSLPMRPQVLPMPLGGGYPSMQQPVMAQQGNPMAQQQLQQFQQMMAGR